MGEPVKFLRETTSAFSHWAHRVQGEELPEELYGERGSTRPISFKAFTESCVGLLIFTDRQHTAKECCKQLVSDGVYKTLGEGTAGDWEAISEGLAQRAGTQALDPAWLEQSLQESMDSVQQRLRRVCCTGEAAVLMLRLAVRPACLASSWYGPWESGEALQQLTMVNAWSSLVRALKALLVTSGENLAKQYNAINIVSDILHIFYSLSERNTLLRQAAREPGPADIDFGSLVSPYLLQALCLVVEHAAHLPRLHRQHASSGDTALLVAPSLAIMIGVTGGFKTKVGRELLQFISGAPFSTLCADSLSGFADGRLPGNLGDIPEAVDTGRITRASCLRLLLMLMRNYTDGSTLCIPWRRFCEIVPVHRVRRLIDCWLLSSEHAKFGPSTGSLPAPTLLLATGLMRMVSLCCSRAGVPQRSMMLLRSMHLLRHILAACPVTAMADQGAGAQKLLRRPTEPARLPYTPTWGWQQALWGILADAAASASAFVEYPCRIRKVEIDAVHVTGFPSDSMGQARLALFQEEYPSKSWAQYDKRVEATLDIEAAGVVESLLRTTARMPRQGSYAVMLEAQAPLLAHTLLHHPRAWPKHEAALGLLISLRKYLHTQWMRLPWDPENTPFATLPMALLTAVVRKEALLPEHTASFAATQLLPVVLAITQRHLASTPGRPPSRHVCQELLVMCSYLATSSALRVLLGHRELIKLAADMVHACSTTEVEDRASTLDVVCIVAAACDLAIADSGFRTAVNATGEFVVETLFEMYHKARTRFPRDVPGREGLLSLMLFQLSRVLAACAGCDAYGNFKELLTAMEGDLGSVLDWRRTTFWRERRFHRAWEAFWCRVKSQPRYQASHWEDIFRVTLQTHGSMSPVELAQTKAASELLQARSLQLAGQAGLCCNPRCTEMSGRHERSLRTLRCGGGCHHGRFCSRACQRKAWPVHRLVCNTGCCTP